MSVKSKNNKLYTNDNSARGRSFEDTIETILRMKGISFLSQVEIEDMDGKLDLVLATSKGLVSLA